MNKYLMDDRDFYLNRFKNIIKTDTGYKLQPVYAENNNHEIIKLTNCNDEKCCDICIYHNRIAEFNTCEIRNQIEPNLIKNAIIPCSWCNSCDAFTPVYPLNVINSEEEMTEQLSLYFEGLGELSEQDQEYMKKKYAHVKEHLEEIDAQLNSASRGWKTKRMSRVDLAALRLAVYEMEYDEDVPTGVAINEAVELAKRFGGDASGSFVNGVLGKIASEKEEKKNEEETADTEEKAAETPEENA